MKAKSYLKSIYRINPEDKLSRKDYLRLDMNEGIGLPNDFIKEVLVKVTPEFIAMYPEYETLQKKIAIHNKLKPENICLSNGSDAAIKYIFDAYVSVGDKVLFAEPSFAMYAVYCKIFNAKPITVRYRTDLSFPYEDFIQRITPALKLAVLVNPNNPTGSALERSKILEIVKKSAQSNVLLIVDEAYFYFYPETIIEQVKKYQNLIVLRTFSKLCSMASLRLGYAAANTTIIKNLTKVKPTYDVNSLAVKFGKKLFERSYIINKLVKSVSEGREYLIQKLSEQGTEYKDGYANFILIKCGNRTDEVIKKLKNKNILVGGGFKHKFLKDYIRVTIASVLTMEIFWKAFIKVWKG